MSKFCGVISRNENCIHCQPLQFNQLELITEWFVRETDHFSEEFSNKSDFMQAQQHDMLENEQLLTEMHLQLETLKTNVAMLEMETESNAIYLHKLEHGIKSVDRDTNEFFASRIKDHIKMSEHTQMLQMLLRIDSDVMQFDKLLDQMAEYEQYLQLQGNPYGIIFAILDMHVCVLQQVERKIISLAEKSSQLEDSLLQILDKFTLAQHFGCSAAQPWNCDKGV